MEKQEVVSTVAFVEVITFNQIKFYIMQKISVISGGTSGLGLEIAEILVKSGKNVLILGRNKNKLNIASERLKKSIKNNPVYIIEL